MARFKDTNWNLGRTESGHIDSWQQAEIAVLMDIRDELKTLVRIFQCSNFLSLPNTLRQIEKNTRKKARKQPALRSVA